MVSEPLLEIQNGLNLALSLVVCMPFPAIFTNSSTKE